MKTENVNIDILIPDPNNARIHDDRNLSAIKGSLTKFGMQKPIVVDHDNVVIAGNGTLEAAKALGWDTISIVRTDLKGSAAMAYAAADNKTSELAAWDKDILSAQLNALEIEGFDVLDIGFEIDDFKIPDFTPGNENDQGQLDTKEPIICPNCGESFVKS